MRNVDGRLHIARKPRQRLMIDHGIGVIAHRTGMIDHGSTVIGEHCEAAGAIADAVCGNLVLDGVA